MFLRFISVIVKNEKMAHNKFPSNSAPTFGAVSQKRHANGLSRE